uniref:Cytochrome P450 n=1 Tax=Strigamia maritima TaxID=126957 RepID=T1JCU8_STRMM
MLSFVIFAISFAIFLIVLVFYLYPGSRRLTTIPGLDPSDGKDGNLSDITEAGGIHPFLVKLHEKYGEISGFWFGDSYIVSLGSAELFKQHLKVFDRPGVLFKCLEPLIGSDSIQFANGIDGRQRRKHYDRYFSHSWSISYFKTFYEIGGTLVDKWASIPQNEHIPLHQYMMALSLKGILRTAFGFTFSEKDVIKFHRLYELVFSDLCSRLTECKLDSENSHDQRILKAIDEMKIMVSNVIEERKKAKGKEVFVDFLLNESLPKEHLISECLTYIIGGFHTTGNLITWAVYYLASHLKFQDKLYNELCEVFGNGDLTEEKLTELTFLNQIIKETLRLSILAPYAARYQEIDVEIGGHIIPKKTPVLHALGVVLRDPTVWPMPDKFDPTRFEPEAEKSRPSLSFSPFGFAGQRACPAKNFAVTEAIVYLALFFRRFKIGLVDDQLVIPVYSLVSHPEDEIWITVTPRK